MLGALLTKLGNLAVSYYLHALINQRIGDSCHHIGILSGQELRHSIDQYDLRTQALKRLSHFTANGSATHN